MKIWKLMKINEKFYVCIIFCLSLLFGVAGAIPKVLRSASSAR
jgi:hypothetical protein